MGKNILVQRRGRGYFIFKAPTHRRIHSVGYNSVDGHSSGHVQDLLHEMARGAPLALLKVEGAGEIYVPAPEGIAVGQKLLFGSEVPAEIGNIKTLGKMPEGTSDDRGVPSSRWRKAQTCWQADDGWSVDLAWA